MQIIVNENNMIEWAVKSGKDIVAGTMMVEQFNKVAKVATDSGKTDEVSGYNYFMQVEGTKYFFKMMEENLSDIPEPIEDAECEEEKPKPLYKKKRKI